MIMCLCLMPSAMASNNEENTNSYKDAAQLKLEAFEAKIAEKEMKQVQNYMTLQASISEELKASPYSYIAFAATDKDSQKVYLAAIDESDLDENSKEELKTDLQDIWDRYPENFVTEDNIALSDVDTIMNKRFIAEHNATEEGDDIGIKWTATPHRDFAKYACDGSSYYTYAYNAADDPDNSGFDPYAYRYYNHYEDAFWGIGGAPSRCDEFADSAIFAIDNGYQATAHQRFGYACHYLADPGIPFHSKGATDYLGGFSDALFCYYIHNEYESFVYDEWTSGLELKDYVSGNTQSITVSDPEDAVEDNADYSATYYDYIKNEMLTNSNWEDDTTLQYYTILCVSKTAKYSHGLYDYIM